MLNLREAPRKGLRGGERRAQNEQGKACKNGFSSRTSLIAIAEEIPAEALRPH